MRIRNDEITIMRSIVEKHSSIFYFFIIGTFERKITCEKWLSDDKNKTKQINIIFGDTLLQDVPSRMWVYFPCTVDIRLGIWKWWIQNVLRKPGSALFNENYSMRSNHDRLIGWHLIPQFTIWKSMQKSFIRVGRVALKCSVSPWNTILNPVAVA